MDKAKLALGVALVAIVIAIIGCFLPVLPHHQSVAGAISTSDITATNFTEITASVGAQIGSLFLGGTTAATSIGEQVSTGSCAGSATSTQFAVANPFAATSTATVEIVDASAGASSTALKVGTSTSAFPNNTASNLSPTLINATVATSAVETFFSGVLVGSAGQPTPGASTFRTISVGATDYVAGYATSSYPAGSQPGISSCTYKIRWTR